MKKFLYLLFSLFVASCTNIPYKIALKTFRQQNYNQAIEQFDDFITNEGNPALKVKAKHLRSECYFELAKMEMGKRNFSYAADLFFLANSDKADSFLDNCYYQLAQNCIQKKDYETANEYYGFIMHNLADSELMSEILAEKLRFEFEIQNSPKASYETYKILQDEYQESMPYQLSKSIVNKYMPDFINEVKEKWLNNEHDAALEQLFAYQKYPADYENEIKSLIGEIYFSVGENLIKEKKMLEAGQNFRKAEKYSQKLTEMVSKKLYQICKIYIENGDNLLAQRKIGDAIATYQTSLEIIEGFKTALVKISHAKKIEQNIKQASELVAKADEYFENQEYLKARDIYKQAYQLDNIQFIKEKVFNAYSWHRMTTDPIIYSQEIVKNYKYGLILGKIRELKKTIYKKFPRKNVKITEWQVFRSPILHNYEVRYTILTPEKNYFFLWLVRLETGEIIPINKITEEFTR